MHHDYRSHRRRILLGSSSPTFAVRGLVCPMPTMCVASLHTLRHLPAPAPTKKTLTWHCCDAELAVALETALFQPHGPFRGGRATPLSAILAKHSRSIAAWYQIAVNMCPRATFYGAHVVACRDRGWSERQSDAARAAAQISPNPPHLGTHWALLAAHENLDPGHGQVVVCPVCRPSRSVD